MKILKYVSIAVVLTGMAQGQQVLNPQNPYVKLISLSTCFTAEAADGGGNVWLPTIIFKFSSKINIEYLVVKGTFVNTKTSASFGRDIGGGNDIEPGIIYTYKLKTDRGWGAPIKDAPIKINPTVELTIVSKGLFSKPYKVPAVTKFANKECNE